MKSGMVVFNEVLTGSVETVAGVLFDSVKFFQAVHMRRGDKEIKVGPWNDNTREVSFIMPVKIPMSNKTSTPVSETHQITRRDEQYYIISMLRRVLTVCLQGGGDGPVHKDPRGPLWRHVYQLLPLRRHARLADAVAYRRLWLPQVCQEHHVQR